MSTKSKTPLTLLAIETSCDETGIAVVRQEGDSIRVVAEKVASQVDIHAVTGGVVPNVAAREHTAVLRPLLHEVLKEAQVTGQDLSAIAVTVGPGLQPALAVGVNAARTLSFAWRKPLVPVHHLEGHIYSALLEDTPVFPALALLVSGGHTLLVLIYDHLTYQTLGSTRDDAAGEAFDKVARLLGLPYPGGPALSRLAEQGNKEAFRLSRPMLKSSNLDFSFSGLKTEVLYTWRDISAADQKKRRADIAASFEQAVVDTLVGKTERAAAQTMPALLLLAGGVAANSVLRAAMQQLAARVSIPLRVAPLTRCGDNAAMIGQAGLYAYGRGRTVAWPAVDATARLPLEQFTTRSK